MRCRIFQEMRYRPKPQPIVYVENAEDYVFPDLEIETVWEWVAQVWDEEDPPWKDGSSIRLPKTWMSRSVIFLGGDAW